MPFSYRDRACADEVVTGIEAVDCLTWWAERGVTKHAPRMRIKPGMMKKERRIRFLRNTSLEGRKYNWSVTSG
jgi:hypothetical protein